MHDLERRLGKLESWAAPLPAVRWVVAETPADEAAAEATQKPGELLVIWRMVDPQKPGVWT
jgi:hypothetical protein